MKLASSDLADLADFLLIYLEEAHPSEKKHFEENIVVKEHKAPAKISKWTYRQMPLGKKRSHIPKGKPKRHKIKHKNMKSKRFRRDLCGRDLNHPVCGKAFEGHQKKLALSPTTLISAGLRAGLAEGID